MRPRISVVVATRNRRQQLARALASIDAQRYRRFEVIVVDDGSADGTAAWLRAQRPQECVVETDRPRAEGDQCLDGPLVADNGIDLAQEVGRDALEPSKIERRVERTLERFEQPEADGRIRSAQVGRTGRPEARCRHGRRVERMQ